MAGGLSGSTSSSVEIPPEIMGKAIENLNRAQGVQNYNPIPFMGPAVAAINPMQQAGMQSAMDAGAAFGLAGPTNVSSMLPQAETFAGGIQGYSAYPMFEQAMASARQAYPDQMKLFDRFQAPTQTPVGGAGNYGVASPSAGTSAGVSLGAPNTNIPEPAKDINQGGRPMYGGLLDNTLQPTAPQPSYGGQSGAGSVGDQFGLGSAWTYTGGSKTDDQFLTDLEKGKVNFEAIRFYSPTVEKAREEAEEYFVNRMGIFDSRKDMDKYLHVVRSENNTFRFEYDSGSLKHKLTNPSLKVLGAGKTLNTTNYNAAKSNYAASGGTNPYLDTSTNPYLNSGSTNSTYNPYLTVDTAPAAPVSYTPAQIEEILAKPVVNPYVAPTLPSTTAKTSSGSRKSGAMFNLKRR